jgi:hypothetical protein
MKKPPEETRSPLEASLSKPSDDVLSNPSPRGRVMLKVNRKTDLCEN